jgi:hypothetical protein
MLIFINKPALAMSLALRSLDEGVQEPRPGRRTRVRAQRTSGTKAIGSRGWRLAKSLRLAH